MKAEQIELAKKAIALRNHDLVVQWMESWSCSENFYKTRVIPVREDLIQIGMIAGLSVPCVKDIDVKIIY